MKSMLGQYQNFQSVNFAFHSVPKHLWLILFPPL